MFVIMSGEIPVERSNVDAALNILGHCVDEEESLRYLEAG